MLCNAVRWALCLFMPLAASASRKYCLLAERMLWGAGRILFPGRTNNEMLKLMMDAKGAFPKKMLRRAAFAEKHFEDDVNCSFRLWEEDPVTARPARPSDKEVHLGSPASSTPCCARLPAWDQQKELALLPSAVT